MSQPADEASTLEVIVRQHARFVFKVAYGVLRNIHDAEDVTQEVFLRVHRSGTKGVLDIKAWLARIAFRLALDQRRKLVHDPIGEIDLEDSGASAEELLMQGETIESMRRLITTLPDELRFPLVLSTLEELNSRQLADVLGTSESAVRGRIFRARQILKERLAAMAEKKL